MIDLYYYTSPNARKALIMLEETGLPYRVVWVDITAGEQFAPEYLAINPNNKIPAIIDHDGPDGGPIAIFESGAILVYLAEKSGKLMPTDAAARYEVLAWVFWQTSSQGPLLGQAAHFVSHAQSRGISADYAIDRYRGEAERLYAVLDSRLEGRAYLCGEYSIADIAAFPWVRVAKGQGIKIEQYPNVKRWCDSIAARPAATKRLDRDAATKAAAKTKYYDDEAWRILFGGKRPTTSPGQCLTARL
jgi:GSH-dependent disulfide-bond oxidoreductase